MSDRYSDTLPDAPLRDPSKHPLGEFAFVWHEAYEMDIGRHVFPTAKFRLLRDELIARGLLDPRKEYRSPFPDRQDLLRAMEPAYLEDFAQLRRTPRTWGSELPLTPDIVAGFTLCAGGTLLAAQLALRGGAGAFHIGGGFHHAFRGHAEGFCYVNDVAVAALAMLDRSCCERVAIIDVDVHQGNGTAKIFEDDPRVLTFSIHQQNNYPVEKEASSIDVGLPDRAGGAEYLRALRDPLLAIFSEFQPDLVFYVAGADPYVNDQLGGLALTMDDMRARDALCLGRCAEAGAPFVVVTAGGYARQLSDTIALHAITAEEALKASQTLAAKGK
jgi:acetoin utilization deacetylase AcuC-like enzyme